jgi:beta-glucosidase
MTGGFSWGVATSAYQIEGGRGEGKGTSIWDVFSDAGRLPDPGDVACDHFHRWQEDVELMAALGVDAYRFSLAWTRILPDGTGKVNQAGIDFYSRLIDALLERGIAPWVTFYHWDLPQALQERGGWPVRSTVEAFVDYVEVVAGAFGDRIGHWITHNEPWVATILGHVEGSFAPGLADWELGLRAGHHLLLSHGRAVEALRRLCPGSSVGIALDCRPARPASPSEEDREAYRHFDGFRNRWFFDPVFGRGYPSDLVDDYRERGHLSDLSFVEDGDLEVISAPIDFLGINYYTSLTVAAGADETEDSGVTAGPRPPPGYTEMGWEVTPASLTEFLRRVDAEYSPVRIVVTENGASYSDRPGPDGKVHDQRRIDYLNAHIGAVAEARAGGVPVEGYFVWSLLDNLEWISGFSQRFGLVYVDHASGRRTPKDSFYWYRDLIRSSPDRGLGP